MPISRRKLVAGAVSLFALRGAHAAEAGRINVLSNGIGFTVAHTGPGGDVAAEAAKATGITGDWTPVGDQNGLYERLMREVSLRQTGVDIGFVLNSRMTSRVASLMEPLDEYMAASPIEEFADVFPNMVKAMQVDGKTYGIPFRQALSGLHVNQTFLRERGLDGPPKTIEELLEYAKRLTYTRADGSKVYGFLLVGVGFPGVVGYARGWNGDYITTDFKVAANQPPMVRTLAALHEMYATGAFPKAFTTIQEDDFNTWMQQGRAAMCITAMGRHTVFNDPKKSSFAGQVQSVSIPASAELKGRFDVAPATVETWNLVIPRNSTRKKQAWEYIRALVSRDNVLKAALNGNGPIRASTYDNPTYAGSVSYAAAERRSLAVARPPMPAFDNGARAVDMYAAAFQAAVLGDSSPQEAMDGLARSVAPLLPKAG